MRHLRLTHPDLDFWIDVRLREWDGRRLAVADRAAKGPRPQFARTYEVTVLDVAVNIASVKVVSEPLVDYLHLAKLDGPQAASDTAQPKASIYWGT